MNTMDSKGTEILLGEESKKSETGGFKLQFKDQENSHRLRANLRVEEIFEKADLKQMTWKGLSSQMQSYILNREVRKGEYGIPERPWERIMGYQIFGKPEKGSYYFLRKMGKNYAWSRIWLNGEMPHYEKLHHDSSLSEIIDTVALHEFGEKAELKQGEAKRVEETRGGVRKNLRPWENR